MTQNRYVYVHNNPLQFVDPSGMDSYHVCRPLDNYAGAVAAHCFVVAYANSIGNPKAIVYSYGDRGDDVVGRVNAYTQGFSDTTYFTDLEYWQGLSPLTVPNTAFNYSGSPVSAINAMDFRVSYLAESVIENRDYSLMFGINSNSASHAVAYSADENFPGSGGNLLKPGSMAWREISFDLSPKVCTGQ